MKGVSDRNGSFAPLIIPGATGILDFEAFMRHICLPSFSMRYKTFRPQS